MSSTKMKGVTQQTIDERRVQVVKNPSSLPLGGNQDEENHHGSLAFPGHPLDCHGGQVSLLGESHPQWIRNVIRPSPLSVCVRPCVVFHQAWRFTLSHCQLLLWTGLSTQKFHGATRRLECTCCATTICVGMFPFMGMPRTLQKLYRCLEFRYPKCSPKVASTSMTYTSFGHWT